MQGEKSLRLSIVSFIIAIFSLVILIKLIYLQIFASSSFKKIAQKQHTYILKLSGERGKILDSQGLVLAEDIPSYSLYALPAKIRDKEELAKKLAQILEKDYSEIFRRISKDKPFVWIKRKLTKEEKEELASLKEEGLGFIEELRRFYPQKNLASHILGTVNIDNRGLEGLELKFDDYLRAKEGRAIFLRDSRGRILPLYRKLIPSRDGFNLVLNIDFQIQYFSQRFLEETVKETKAKAGEVVVLQPSTGKILALANFPDFDPNIPSEYPFSSLRNRVITDFYEPGSVFKIVTLLASLGERSELLSKKFFCENGSYKIPGSILHDWKEFSELSFEEVFKNSSNIGVAKIASILGREVLYRYIKKLRFGEITGVDLPGEVKGIVKPLSRWSKTSSFIIPIGQEIAVTLIQLARAFSVIANGGYLVRPYVVDKIVDNKGVLIKKFYPQRKKIFSKEVIEKAKEILFKVVEEGTGRRAKVEGMKIAGKTGTAQKIDEKGGYSSYRYYASFVGFFPLEEPQYLIGVVIDEPKTYHYGGMVAAPLFKKIAEKVIEYKRLK